MTLEELLDLSERLQKPREIDDFRSAFADPKIVTNVQGQAARKNPAWKRSLVKVMKKHGFELVGAGINGAVFRNSRYPFVLKVYRSDEGFDEWLHFILTHKTNVYVPRLRGKPIRLNDVFTAIRMEPLEPCPNDKANAFSDHLETVMPKAWSCDQTATLDPDLLDLARFMRDWESHNDITPHNLMCRADGQVVVIDPIYVNPEMQFS